MDKLFYKFERAWESLVLEKFVKDDCNHVKDGESGMCWGRDGSRVGGLGKQKVQCRKIMRASYIVF